MHLYTGSSVLYDAGSGGYATLWTFSQFRQQFGRDWGDDVCISAMNGDWDANGRQVTSVRVTRSGNRIDVMFDGKLVWPLDKDTVVSIRITDDKGRTLPKSLAVNGTLKLGAKATYADGHVGDLLTTKDVTFTSRDTSTATVSGNTLTWRHGGTILVTATVNGFTSAAVSISAAYAPESIKVTDDSGKPIDNITLRVGESKNLKVTILPDAASQEYTASIKDVSLASVRQQ